MNTELSTSTFSVHRESQFSRVLGSVKLGIQGRYRGLLTLFGGRMESWLQDSDSVVLEHLHSVSLGLNPIAVKRTARPDVARNATATAIATLRSMGIDFDEAYVE